MDENVRAHVVISGTVQGVAYRYSTRDAAIEYGVCGWVKNNRDGTVEAVFEGSKDNVTRMLKWCEKGPRMAVVEGVDVRWETYSGNHTAFEITF